MLWEGPARAASNGVPGVCGYELEVLCFFCPTWALCFFWFVVEFVFIFVFVFVFGFILWAFRKSFSSFHFSKSHPSVTVIDLNTRRMAMCGSADQTNGDVFALPGGPTRKFLHTNWGLDPDPGVSSM